jgi:hypothetical protein
VLLLPGDHEADGRDIDQAQRGLQPLCQRLGFLRLEKSRWLFTTSGGRLYAQRAESFRNESGQPRQGTWVTLGRLELGGDVDRLTLQLCRAPGIG